VNDQLRIGDNERETAARELGEHFAMGRITAEEHTERLEQVWAARTNAELQPVFRDLPRPRPATPAPPKSPTTSSRSTAPEWWPPMPRVPFLFKLLVAIVVLSVAFHHLWFLLIALLVYVLVIRRFTHRRRWAAYRGRSHTGWR
jgi:Flp pilus assembly protein TadB